MIWEPNGKSPPGHRLLDSDRPATSYFKYGSVTTNGETIFLEKNRILIWLLAFVVLTPVWVGLMIGLGFLLELLAKNFTDSHVGFTLLFLAATAISSTVLVIVKIFKPIRRQFSRSQIANARINHLQSFRNNAPTRAGLLGIDFSVVPPGALVEGAPGNGSLRIASPAKCSFVTLVALDEGAAKLLWEWMPTTQVALEGKLNPNIPPQQAAPKTPLQMEAAASRQLSRGAGARTEKRYAHNMKPWGHGLWALFFGYLAFSAIKEAMKNERGMIINGIIHVGRTGTTISEYFFAAMFCCIFLSLAALVLRCIFNPHSLLVGPEGLTFFGGWLPKKTFVSYSSIDSVFQQQNIKGGNRALLLKAKGQRFEVAEAYLKIPGAYDEIHEAIESGRTNSRKVSSAPPPVPTPTPDKKIPEDDSRYMPKK